MKKVVQIKIIFLFLLIASLQSSEQITDCSLINVIKDVSKKNFSSHEEIQISFKNVSSNLIEYQLDVFMYNGKNWEYSPYYTRYFNHDLSEAEMKKLSKSKLPVVFSDTYYHPASHLKANEVAKISFKVKDRMVLKKLIRFRLHLLNGRDKCDIIFFKPFYFVNIV